MIQVDLEKHPTLTEPLIQLALADYVQWWRVIAVPNLCLWHEMDMAVLTRAGCLWEFEIKVSQSDWNGDHRKDKADERDTRWRQQMRDAGLAVADPAPRRNLTYVDRFYYVYAEGLRAPQWVPEWAGLIEARHETIRGSVYIRLTEHRAAKRRGASKPSDAQRAKMLLSTYRRFWNWTRGVPIDRQAAIVAAELHDADLFAGSAPGEGA